jgi:UDP-GlcNAc:undecaprenyl-phosphate GlcNAc-1-phosphate transferase
MLAILIGSFLIIIVGIIDDISPLRPLWKLLGQIVASLIVVIYGGITFSDMTIFGLSIKFGIAAIPLTVLFIVAIINAINLSDGLDGLAAGSSAIFFLSISIIAYIMNKLGGLDVILCLIMLGATLGFLVFNFNPASIFMGDTGSMFLGFIISIVALLGFKTATITSLIIPILILFVPIIDTLSAIIRRSLKGQAFSSADREHLHHQILDSTKSTKKTVLIMYLIDILFASVSILYALGDNKIAMIIYLILLILFAILVFKTDIIIEHKKDR